MAKKRQAPGERASLLDKPRVLYAEPGYLSQGLFYGVLLLLGSVGSLGCFFGAFQVPVSPWPAVAVGSGCLLFFLVLFYGSGPPGCCPWWASSCGGRPCGTFSRT